jgi:sec-independent protein translocase protein TatB
MFEIGFAELLVIAVVALLALGPERLPTAARKLGATLRWARQHWEQVRGEIERELDAEPLRKGLSQVPTPAELFQPLKRETDAIERELKHVEDSTRLAPDGSTPTAAGPSPSSTGDVPGVEPPPMSEAGTALPASARDRE